MTPRYSVTVAGRATEPGRCGRLLVPEPRAVASLREARRWMSRMAATWCAALLPSEEGFSGFVLDDDGTEALALEYGRDPDALPVEHDRDDLEELKKTTARGDSR